MPVLWQKSGKLYKSPLRVIVKLLQRKGERKEQKCELLKQKMEQVEQELAECKKEIDRRDREIHRLGDVVRTLSSEARELKRGIRLPDDPPIAEHGYGPRMVALSVNLAKAVGLRGAERVLKIFWDALGVEQDVPNWTAIRTWIQRLGVDALKQPVEKSDDWIWMVDHSNQIGQEKVLVVLGVRASEMPASGSALTHGCLHVIDVRPGTDWKKEDMGTVYNELAERHGTPRAILMDGATELREGVLLMKTGGPKPIVLSDFKHKAANLLKAILGKDERFTQFMTQVGNTRSAIQQTELAFLVPTSVKQKARFMNMQSRIRWASVVMWLLNEPDAKARQWVPDEKRLEEKLGWMREYADDLTVWQECERIIEESVTFMNEQGLSHGMADRLRELIGSIGSDAISRRLAEKLVEFVSESEALLKPGERFPMSTEILESSFGLYKQLERQHSKGGFTGLLASFGALLKKYTSETVHESLSRTSVQEMRAWIKKHLGTTLTMKRQSTYREFRAANGATKTAATG